VGQRPPSPGGMYHANNAVSASIRIGVVAGSSGSDGWPESEDGVTSEQRWKDGETIWTG
jgi:hypothetical protein